MRLLFFCLESRAQHRTVLTALGLDEAYFALVVTVACFVSRPGWRLWLCQVECFEAMVEMM